MDESSDIQNELDTLPKGTIVRRKIRGTDRFYHQWRENGVTKSRYLSPGEIEPLRALLDRRAYLQSLGTVPENRGTVSAGFRCDVLTGRRLAEYAAAVSDLPRRGGVPAAPTFLIGPAGVGKTTLLRQLVHDLPPTRRAKAAYVRLTPADTARDLTQDLNRLRDLGFETVFVDNAEFLDGLGGTGLELVLAGTAVPPALRGLVRPADLSFIPFREARRLLGTVRVEDLVERGGTLGGGTPPSPQDKANDRFVLDVLSLAVLRARDAARASGEAFLGTDLQKLRHRFAELSGLVGEEDPAAREALLAVPSHLRFAHARARIGELLTDPILARLGAAERKMVRDLLLAETRFRLLEDNVWNELRHARTRDAVRVHRIPFAPGAYGFVIVDEEELVCEIVTLTTDDVRNPLHLRYLDDPARLDAIEHRYGMITGREILYNGRDARLASGVSYRNLEKYLLRLA